MKSIRNHCDFEISYTVLVRVGPLGKTSLARAVRFPSLLLVLCQVKQEQSYAYSTTSDVSQAGED